jgi:nucleoside-diphosphate-sugar epimerase
VLVLITGDRGFVGQRVCALLDERGIDWYGYDVQRDEHESVLNAGLLNRCAQMMGADVIVHLAGPVEGSFRDSPDYWFTMQTQGTFNVLNAAKKQSARVVLASSFYVYEGNGEGEFVNEGSRLEPDGMGLFALSKYVAERLCKWSGVPHCSLRFGSLYGGGGSNLVDDYLDALSQGEPMVMWGAGQRKHQFTHVDDVAEGVLRAIIQRVPVGAKADWSGPVNLISEEVVTTKHLVEMIREYHPHEPKWDPMKHERQSFPFMSSRLAKELGWKPSGLAGNLR